MAISGLHRRHVLAGLGTALLAPGAHAATPPLRRKLGAAAVMVIGDGTLNVPLSFMLPETPAAEAAALASAAGLPPPGSAIPTNVTLVTLGEERILIDVGAGGNF